MDMNKKFTYLSSFLIGVVAMLLCPLVVHAQEGDPIISFHTNIYAKATSAGTTPMVYLSLGATDSTTLSVDGGNGGEEAEVGKANLTTTEQGEVAVKGSPVSVQVDANGWVKIYGDASKIDYFNASGQEIDQIQFSDQLGLKILNLEHNSLQALNINKLQKLQVIYLEDNPFTAATPLMIGRLPNLQVLEVTQIGHISPSFTLKNFPNLVSFDAYHTVSLTSCDPTGCPNLRRLSLDMTSVSSVNLSQNPLLEVLNVSDSRIKTLDLSRSSKIKQLYASHSSGSINTDVKFDEINVRYCPLLTIFYCDGNNLTNLDLSRNPELFTFSCARNKLRNLDLTKNTKLYSVNVRYNYLDFVTLPQPGNWFEYYHEQNNLEVNPTYSVGSVVDLSSRVNRPSSTTNGVLYRVPKDDPTKPEKLSDDYYDYANGKVTLKRALDDEVFIQYDNSVLKDYSLRTENFRIKTTAEFGQDDKAFSFVTGNAQGSAIKMAIGVKDATAAAPVKVKIDFGNGTKVERIIVDELPTAVNVTGTLTGSNVVTVYVPQDKQITVLGTDGVKMSKIDLDNLPQLRHLALIHADLDSVGLGYNNKLETLNLSYNNMRKVSLKGPSTYFDKSILTDINLSHNNLETIEYNNITVVRHLDVSYNKLVKLGVNNADNLRSFDASHNQFNTMLLNHSELLENLNISYNQLSKFYVPANAPLKTLDIRGNFFTLANMPDYLALGQGKFLYAPQNPLEISTASPGIDLSEQYITKNGKVTQFKWKKSNNQVLAEGTDYTINNGSSKFKNTNTGRIYCEMTHEAYPDFKGVNVFRTTYTTPIPMPTNVLAEFTTVNQTDSVDLSLASPVPGTSVYFEWSGDNNVYQYTLKDTYTRFRAKSKAGARVRVLVANPTDELSVFSVSNVQMENADLSKLGRTHAITLSNTSLESVKLPADAQYITQLNLSGNKLASFDVSKYPNLSFLSLADNKISSIDLSSAKKLELAMISNNSLTSIVLDNPILWNLDLSVNKLESIDVSKLPKLQQLFLASNRLTAVSVPYKQNPELTVLNLVGNRLRFSTMPPANERVTKAGTRVQRFNKYSYNLQDPIKVECVDGKVDLSSEVTAGGKPTTFRWFVGNVQVIDGELQGEELELNESYTLENGVTTLKLDNPINNLVCVMTNLAFPSAVLHTDYVKYVPTGIDAVKTNEDVKIQFVAGGINIVGGENSPVAVYSIDGKTIYRAKAATADMHISLAPGTYIVRVGNKASKICLK
ncbi:hypothetical protein [Prevotella sp.]